MSSNRIDANLLRGLFLAGAQRLEENKETINLLNVFPVPDGDTGTNMSMTLQGAVSEITMLPADASMEQISKAISSGSLRGARGNSGVILSQLLRGFCRTIRDEKEELSAPVIAAAMVKATETAYKAVMKPMEGTILTVAKAMSEKALSLTAQDDESEDIAEEADLLISLKQVIDAGQDALSHTPEMLPVLKEAGVVDSGGQGLISFMNGIYDFFAGAADTDKIGTLPQTPAISAQEVSNTETMIRKERTRKPISTDDIKYGYCTEFLVLTKGEVPIETENEFKKYLASIGDSIVCVSDEEIIKVHVHTNDPGLAIQKGLTYGMLSNLKIDNMRLEHQNTLVTQAEIDESKADMTPSEPENPPVQEKNAPVQEESTPVQEQPAVAAPIETPVTETAPVIPEPPVSEPAEVVPEPPVSQVPPVVPAAVEEKRKPGFVTVVSGEGLAGLFREMGVDVVIEGGQTMNPSTEDIMRAIESIQADPVYILPNNKNIIMSANQARDLCEDKRVYVVPTKTIPQGITAMISNDPSMDPEENAAMMAENASATKSLEITYAVRTTKISGHKIKKGDIIGLDDDGIKASGREIDEVALRLLDSNIDEDSCVVSVFAGKDTDRKDAESLVARISAQYPSVDVDLYDGGQPLYYYIFAVD